MRKGKEGTLVMNYEKWSSQFILWPTVTWCKNFKTAWYKLWSRSIKSTTEAGLNGKDHGVALLEGVALYYGALRFKTGCVSRMKL